jgi:hypothetical protein
MHSSCEFDSNEIDESDSQEEKHDSQEEKHDSPRFSPLCGMTIDFNEQNKNAQD